MTIEEAIARIEDHVSHHGIGEYPHIEIGEALKMAVSALHEKGRATCGRCAFWRENDPRCMNGKSPWGGRTVKKDDACSGFEEREPWISAKERLPKRRADYLCAYVFDESKMRFYGVLMFHPEQDAENGYIAGPHFSNEGMDGMHVTHWMPLPEPPKEECL